MQDYLHAQRHWLTVERLPGYAPDLNPVETLWSNIKGQERSTVVPRTWRNWTWPYALAWRESRIPASCRFPFCNTRSSFFEQNVTVLCEIK